jgi:hypothetical protein
MDTVEFDEQTGMWHPEALRVPTRHEDVLLQHDGAQEAQVRGQPALLTPMFEHLHAHAAERRRSPREDLLTRLVEHQDAAAKVRADPSLLPAAIEESLGCGTRPRPAPVVRARRALLASALTSQY